MIRRRRRWLLASLGAVVVLLVAAGAFVYFVVLEDDAPPPLALGQAPAAAEEGRGSSTSSAPAGQGVSGPLAGRWTVGPGSVAGYRVREQLASLPARSDAVARTSDITGEVVLSGPDDALVVQSATFEVDVTTLVSDPPARRDNRMRTEGLQTDQYPTASFALTSPVVLPPGAASGDDVVVDAPGDLQVHGSTQPVVVPLQARRTGGAIEVVGSLTFAMADFAIDPPDIAGFVSVEDEATLELQVFLTPA